MPDLLFQSLFTVYIRFLGGYKKLNILFRVFLLEFLVRQSHRVKRQDHRVKRQDHLVKRQVQLYVRMVQNFSNCVS